MRRRITTRGRKAPADTALLGYGADGTAVLKARAELRRDLMKGTDCPCCGARAKIYWRSLSPVMACFLIWLYRNQLGGHEWVPSSAGPFRGGDYAKVWMWGLAERGSEKGRTSHWRLTSLGEQFVQGKVPVARYAASFRGQEVGLSTEERTIHEVLARSAWDYDKLMGR